MFIIMHKDSPKVLFIKILNYLNTIFGDQHKAQRAVKTLHMMKQDLKESFLGFIPYFEKALANVEGME